MQGRGGGRRQRRRAFVLEQVGVQAVLLRVLGGSIQTVTSDDLERSFQGVESGSRSKQYMRLRMGAAD